MATGSARAFTVSNSISGVLANQGSRPHVPPVAPRSSSTTSARRRMKVPRDFRVEPFGLEAVPDLPRLDALSDHSINWEGPWRSIRTRRAYCLPWPEAPC